MKQEVKRNYLEINSLHDLKESKLPSEDYSLELLDPMNFQLNKFFYKNIGKKHNWVDRLIWTDQQWIDEYTYTLEQGEGIEVKLVMEEGAEAEFLWVAEGGVLNYDLHGDGSGNNISYEKGRAVPTKEGVLKAAFTGNHGWFWRNRDKQKVTVKLFVRGAYSEMVEPK